MRHLDTAGAVDLHEYVRLAAAAGELVVQPRMGLARPTEMAAGLRAVAEARARTVGTITLDSYTRVGDHDAARRALTSGQHLNGFPIVVHGAEITAAVADTVADRIPVQVRHGSALPGAIFAAMSQAGLNASEGGPVSYCLPYGRTPLADSVRHWDLATGELAESTRARGARAHLETFGGCMLGQLCPPSMLITISVLEAMFFAQRGIPTVSLSYAQQTNPVQDIEALAALRLLAAEMLPRSVEWHVVLYTYMGVYPRTEAGARGLLDESARLAVHGGAERLIVKTVAEAERIPTVAENIAALERAAHIAKQTRRPGHALPWSNQVDCGEILTEARALVAAVLDGGDDVGGALRRAFASGVLDVPFCLHQDNLGLTQTRISDDGRLEWARTGRLPLPAKTRMGQPVSALRLLSMLRFTADSYDQPTLRPSGAEPALPALGEQPYRVAVVGSGPRAIAILERLAARIAAEPPDRPVEISVFDSVEVGCGRIWRTDQPPWFLMNTVAGEVTMFSGGSDGGPARPGAGPTLAGWWQQVDPDCPGPKGYAPRPLYGAYLQFVFGCIERSLPATVTLRRMRAEVVNLVAQQGGYRLTLADGSHRYADRVVLATGHAQPRLDRSQQRLADFARDRQHLLYIGGDSASDMDLHRVRPGTNVGILGLGLSFYDVMVALTIGRGGQFHAREDGTLRYVPSGTEPRLVAGSRSGVPIPARGKIQKPPDHSYQARVFTAARISTLRGRRRLDFRRDVLPLLIVEMELVYYGTEVRLRYGEDVAERFARRVVASCAYGRPDPAVARLAAQFGVDDLAPLDLQALTRPFAGQSFTDPEAFDAALIALIEADLVHAEAGNANGPLKAACDVIRDTRSTIRAAVDFSGLEPDSHRKDFLEEFTPLGSFLAAGPPLVRLRQVKALIESGVLRVIGPSACFDPDPETDRFLASSPQVGGARLPLDVVIDARIPTPDLHRELAPLPRRLYESGLWTTYTNTDGSQVFETGGVAVTGPPFHPIRRDGAAETGLYVLGIPTEHTRWFTQVGSGRPGRWAEFTRDADTIAAHLLTGIEPVPRLLPTAEMTGDPL